jgi:PST family polysaccharide transporter
MKAYKSTALLAASTAVRMLLALYTVKVTAVSLGLSGTGVIGQFNNLLLIATVLAGGGIASGIIKTAAQHDKPLVEIRRELSFAHGYGLMCTVLIVLAVVAGQEWLVRLLPIEHGAWLLISLAVGQYGLFQIAALTALVNSRGRQDLFAKSSLAAGVVGAAMVTVGCLHFGLVGTLVGILAGALSQWGFLYVLTRRHLPDLAWLGRPRLERKGLAFWAHFTLLSLITVVGMPSALIGVRNALAASAGWDTVGIWQAMVRLSDAYLQFGLLFLSAFYFPRLAASPTIAASTAVLLRHARLLVPGMVLLCVTIYLLRFQIVPTLFSVKFIGVTELFVPQLIGDFFKITSYLITYAFLATGRYKLSITAELTQAALFWAFASQIGVPLGAAGVAWSYAATYAAYFALVATTYALLVRADRIVSAPAPITGPAAAAGAGADHAVEP